MLLNSIFWVGEGGIHRVSVFDLHIGHSFFLIGALDICHDLESIKQGNLFY